ncbi:transcriptional regulator [Natronococcus pandeyae]|uniref:Transcriptional regulator n=1 Tax=Natronococcus pandeyae TaxID=2055836 RepID=A0A8J8TQ85_9EURY|nr:transcriptional regulator [Natronococcus pandeyae]
MTHFQFTCSGCSQQIDVDEAIRDAVLSYGCPVCASAVSMTDFAPRSQRSHLPQ